MHIRILSLLAVAIFGLSNAYAVESVAKEDTNPPAPEGALPAERIPAISNIGKPATPAQPPKATETTAPTQQMMPPALTNTAPPPTVIPVNPGADSGDESEGY